MSLFGELKRRNVLRVGAAYVVASWLLIQVAETIFPLFGFDETPARIVVIVLAIGLVPSLILAWAFELTPEGFKKEKDIDRSESVSPGTGKKLDRVIMVVLALALGYFAFDKFVLEPQRDLALEQQKAAAVAEARQRGRTEALVESYGDRSIAVLPFVNMSSDEEQAYFSDGIAEELLNLLAKIPELRVISRSSSFSLRDKDMDIPSIAEQLNVALVLEGSVRKHGNQVRITAQLIEARSDTHLWSETYDRALDNVFAIQDEISAAIVESLRDHISLQLEEAPRTVAAASTEAHDAYLRGRHLLAQRGAAVETAAREFEKAISLDPDYALAHAQLAITYQLGYLGLTISEMDAKAAPHVEKAMALDPTLAEAHAAAGLLAWTAQSLELALRHFETAIQINPNYADVYTWKANILDWWLGRYAEAFAMREKAVQLDPLSIPGMNNYVTALIARGRLAEADRELEKLSSIVPSAAVSLRGWRLSAGGNWANGLRGVLEAMLMVPEKQREGGLAPWFVLIGLEKEAMAAGEGPLRRVMSFLGKHREAVAAAQARYSQDPDDQRARDALGLALAAAGDYAEARPWLEESWQRYEGTIVSPIFGVEYALALIAARRAVGEEEKLPELIAAIEDNIRRYREAEISTFFYFESADYEQGLAHLLAGDDQRGLELIARAVEDGFFIPLNQAYLQDLYEHPDFTAVLDIQEARQARERAKVLAIICEGNPYAAVWQPAEGTCAQFAAGDGD